MRDIRHIAVSNLGDDLFATAEFDRTVEVWSLRQKIRIAKLTTVLDFGGSRLALSAAERLIVVGSHSAKMVAAYDFISGELLWERKEEGVQQVIAFDWHGQSFVGIGKDEPPYLIVNSNSGREHFKVPRARRLFTTPNLWLAETRKSLELYEAPSNKIWERPLKSFAILDVAFSEDRLLLSEAGGNVRCFTLEGDKEWELSFGKEQHALQLAWNSRRKEWVARVWNYEHGGPKQVYSIDLAGRPNFLRDVSNSAAAAFLSGEILINSDGAVINVESGRETWNFCS